MYNPTCVNLYALLYGRWEKIGRGLIWTAISDLTEKIIEPPKKSQRGIVSLCAGN